MNLSDTRKHAAQARITAKIRREGRVQTGSFSRTECGQLRDLERAHRIVWDAQTLTWGIGPAEQTFAEAKAAVDNRQW